MKRININNEGKIKLFLSLSLFIYASCVTAVTKNLGACFAMWLAMMGDISIMASRGCIEGKKIKTFDLGVLFFTFSHLTYVCAMYTNFASVAIALLSLISVLLITLFQPIEKKWNYIPYIIALFNSAINAWLFSWVAGIGMILFLISDTILGICESKNPKWQIAIWGTYVPAQVLLLTAILIA